MKYKFLFFFLLFSSLLSYSQHPNFLGKSLGEPATVILSELSKRGFDCARDWTIEGNHFFSYNGGKFDSIPNCHVTLKICQETNKIVNAHVTFPETSDTTIVQNQFELIKDMLCNRYGLNPDNCVSYDESKPVLFKYSNASINIDKNSIHLSIYSKDNNHTLHLIYTDKLNKAEVDRKRSGVDDV